MKIQASAWLLLFCLNDPIEVQGWLPASPSNKNYVSHSASLMDIESSKPPIRTHNNKIAAYDSLSHSSQSRNLSSSWIAAAYFFAACAFSWCEPTSVLAVDTMTPNMGGAAPTSEWMKNIGSSLSKPTEDTPRISLPDLSGASQGTSATSFSPNKQSESRSSPPAPWRVQGLVSLLNPRMERPYASDFMIVQVLKEPPPKEPYAITDDTKNKVLGGAKIPVGKVRFPSSITLGLENAKSPEIWKELSSKQDLWLEATICKEDSAKFPCAPEEQRYRGVASSKLFGGLQTSESDTTGPVIRLPATLVLERLNADED